MDELKNLVIQTLEQNGILAQIRAKLRCAVFSVSNNNPRSSIRTTQKENPML